MTTSRRNTTHSFGLLGAALVTSLLISSCSHSSGDEAAPATTDQSTTTAVFGGLDEKTEGATTTTTAPASTPTPKPAAQPADPPASTTTVTSLVNLIPPGGLHILPSVTSLKGRTSYTCAEATNDSNAMTINWTTAFAAKVSIEVKGWGQMIYPDQPANGSHIVGIPCGITETITVTAIGSNGVAGGSKTLTVVIDAP